MTKEQFEAGHEFIVPATMRRCRYFPNTGIMKGFIMSLTADGNWRHECFVEDVWDYGVAVTAFILTQEINIDILFDHLEPVQ